MKIQAELSLYPLKTNAVENVVGRFIEDISGPGISIVPGAMSTLIAGECENVFRAVSQCFEKACTTNAVVLAAKFSNACPTNAEFDPEKK